MQLNEKCHLIKYEQNIKTNFKINPRTWDTKYFSKVRILSLLI